jgi:hypothetical protein
MLQNDGSSGRSGAEYKLPSPPGEQRKARFEIDVHLRNPRFLSDALVADLGSIPLVAIRQKSTMRNGIGPLDGAGGAKQGALHRLNDAIRAQPATFPPRILGSWGVCMSRPTAKARASTVSACCGIVHTACGGVSARLADR